MPTEDGAGWQYRIALGSLIEFTAALSVIVLIAGYIWINVVIAVAEAPSRTFTISDYLNSGASSSALLTSVGFISFLSFAITMPWEKPLSQKAIDKLLRSLIYAALAGALISVVLGLYFGFSSLSAGVVAVFAAAVKIVAFAVVFLTARRFGPFKANSATLSIIVALGVWTNCASSAVAFATRARGPIPVHAPVTHYKFEDEMMVSTDWYPLLETERYYYFINRKTGEARLMPTDKLTEVRQLAETEHPIRHFGLSAFGFGLFVTLTLEDRDLLLDARISAP